MSSPDAQRRPRWTKAACTATQPVATLAPCYDAEQLRTGLAKLDAACGLLAAHLLGRQRFAGDGDLFVLAGLLERANAHLRA